MKKIVFCVTSLESGGIENYLLRFLKFSQGQIKPIVICKSNTYGELEESFKQIKDIQLIKLDLGYFNVTSYRKLYSLLKINPPHTLCDFTGNFAGGIMLTANLAAIPNRITFYRGSTNRFIETKAKLIYNKLMLKLVLLNSTKILSNSKAALDFFFPRRWANDSKFKVIYNGIDVKSFLNNSKKLDKRDFGIPLGSFVVGHTGRYTYAKNHKIILKVAEKLCRKYDNIYFILCGKGTDTHLSESLKQNFRLKDKIKLLGYREDINDILSLFDVFFFPSVTEGQPNSLIEAMIFGLPITASNIQPILETTPKKIHKELIDPFDIDGFCASIEKFYLHPKTRIENNCASWAMTKFEAGVLFYQFFNEL